MFGLISYIFKIIISIGAGYIIGYSNDQSKFKSQFFNTLTSFLFAALSGVFYLTDLSLVLIGLIFFGVIYSLFEGAGEYELLDKYKILFSAICGISIGFGFIFHSIITTLLFSYIANNYDIISDLLSSSKKNNNNDDKNHLDLNDEEM